MRPAQPSPASGSAGAEDVARQSKPLPTTFAGLPRRKSPAWAALWKGKPARGSKVHTPPVSPHPSRGHRFHATRWTARGQMATCSQKGSQSVAQLRIASKSRLAIQRRFRKRSPAQQAAGRQLNAALDAAGVTRLIHPRLASRGAARSWRQLGTLVQPDGEGLWPGRSSRLTSPPGFTSTTTTLPTARFSTARASPPAACGKIGSWLASATLGPSQSRCLWFDQDHRPQGQPATRHCRGNSRSSSNTPQKQQHGSEKGGGRELGEIPWRQIPEKKAIRQGAASRLA